MAGNLRPGLGLRLFCMAGAIALTLPFGAQGRMRKPVPGPVFFEVKDTAGLLRAVAKVGAVGGTIRLRPGVYVLPGPLRFRRVNHLNLTGSGWNTTLQARGANPALIFEDCGFCVVRDLLVNGDGASGGSGLLFRGQSSSCTVDFCRISGFAVSGIRFEGVAKTPQSSNTVSRCHLIDNGEDQIYSQNNNDFYIMQNQFGAHARQKERAPRTGTLLDHSSAGTYSANYHWGNRVAMRLTGGSHFNRIENNRFEESREQGVLMGDPTGKEGVYLTVFTGNTVHTNSQARSGEYAAVEAYHAHDITFCANQVFSWDSAALRHRSSLVIGPGCSHWIVKDNILRHNTGKALVYDAATDVLARDNLTD